MTNLINYFETVYKIVESYEMFLQKIRVESKIYLSELYITVYY